MTERALVKWSSISRQLVHSKVVVISPSKGNPQRSQIGRTMKRRFLTQPAQT
jgi:hypothetical protein